MRNSTRKQNTTAGHARAHTHGALSLSLSLSEDSAHHAIGCESLTVFLLSSLYVSLLSFTPPSRWGSSKGGHQQGGSGACTRNQK